ncbi:uncharacterized protein VICG_01624 [Vittaforma corneae ATCC 50505]|uniref:Uncharacterized protein n=1 Tax=Vittaforma corneae (strain ATCC 50505) TaxID=993615 RepID=L2GKH2_VITCO|nr:uncharacterized protein VICG_01624 [Vittaforma corneae ATCC 50505]ELA41383.1 hypothetical protein VICG_01624 [Vittaforma corneae ATCC 50505]
MDEFFQKNTLPETIFPKLLIKHSEEVRSSPESEVLYYKQAHEVYMYEFFKHCKLDCASEIEVNNVKGIAMSPIRLGSFSTSDSVNEDHFFKMLVKAPVPFVYIPHGNVAASLKVCSGACSFRESEAEGILMDLGFACELGIDFLATDFLLKSEVYCVYVGVVHYC